MDGVTLMKEFGFYSPGKGYFQVVGGSPKTADYDKQTIMVPLRPSAYHSWENGQWVESFPDAQTPEQLRTQMPTLSSRQFWLAAHTLGITEDMLIAATEDAEIIIEIRKTTEFYRTFDSVIMLAPLMGITPEQLDDVWMWAAGV